eukprot:821654-Prymnesium_polylepis.1
MSSTEPGDIKALGRRVKGFDEARWVSVRSAVVAYGNYLKFSQNKGLRKTLMATGDLTLVEAARNDTIWGIGLSVKDAAAGVKWRGLNLLGQSLMAARQALGEGRRLPVPPFPECSSADAEETEDGVSRADVEDASAAVAAEVAAPAVERLSHSDLQLARQARERRKQGKRTGQSREAKELLNDF